jgi:hypothetical protein
MNEVEQMRQSCKPALGIVLAIALVLGFGSTAGAQSTGNDPSRDLILVTGEHWIPATNEQKLAFLMGVGNALEVEQALRANKPLPDSESMVPVMMRGLKNFTMTQIMEALDRWYADNPGRRSRPVLETIYFELALPNS